MRYPKVLNQQIALARDELAGQGVYEGRNAEGNRRQELERQIEIWEVLQTKLAEYSD